jgi:hypothetical protein
MANITKEILSPEHITEKSSQAEYSQKQSQNRNIPENITVGLPPSGTP